MIALEELPTRRDEAWKYSDLRGAARHVDGLGSAGAEARFVLKAPDEAAAAGRDFTSPSAIAALARKLRPADVLSYTIAPGSHRALAFEAEAYAGGGAHRVEIVVAPGATLDLFESWRGEDRAMGALSWRIVVEAGARVRRVVHMRDSGGAVVLSDAHIDVHEHAHFEQTAVTTGGKLARLETHVDVHGSGAEIALNGVSLLADGRHADHTTLVTHAAPGATTRETFRSVVTDTATGVFQGKIKVERPAQHTDAQMGHAALLLSDGASVNAKPELEIYADDVACAHGNTAGALDEMALFYLRQRGLPEKRAKALLTRAFIAEVLGDIAHEPTREAVEVSVERWLEAHL